MMKTKTQRMLRKMSDNWLNILIVSVIIIVLVVILVTSLSNYRNKITEGTVVDKSFHPAYTDTEHGYHGPRCSLTISGEKNGRYVEYMFDVPESEYVLYNIGDHYPKRNEG